MTITPADRLAALLREATGGLDRQAAHELLDAALDLAEGATQAEGREGRLANAAALTLSRAVAGWTVPIERSPKEWTDLAKSDPVRWREDAATCLRVAPAVVPQRILDALTFGLMALNDGAKAPPILACAPRPPGYGSKPLMRDMLEQALVTLIEARRHLGVPVGAARREIAAEVLRSTRAIETWERAWKARLINTGIDSAAHTARVFAAARNFVDGLPVAAPIPDELTMIRLVIKDATTIDDQLKSAGATLSKQWREAS